LVFCDAGHQSYKSSSDSDLDNLLHLFLKTANYNDAPQDITVIPSREDFNIEYDSWIKYWKPMNLTK